ncbi:MAG: ABC transporter permease [Bacteroidales bacterium]
MLPYLIEKEFKQIFRNKFLPKILFVLPILQLVILPFAANFEMRNINVAIIDHDHSQTSHAITNQILASDYFNLTDNYNNYPTALQSVEINNSDIIVEFPHDMERTLQREGTTNILISANAVDGTKGALGSSYLTSIITNPDNNNNVGINTIYLNNPHLNYKQFMVPGIIAFLLTLIAGFVSALNIVSEKERGTIEQINVSPLPKHIFILSKLIPFWIIGFIELTLCILIAWLVYGIFPLGNIGIIYLFAAIYLIFCTGFGLAISTISATQQQAMFTAFFFLIIFMLMSGLFTPISSMPEWAQKLTIINPIRYFVELLRMVYLKGSHLADFTHHFIAITILTITANAIAIISYRKNN